jgi:hypothetical protein
MWHKIRLVFPVIFAGIIVFQIYGHFNTPSRRQELPWELADPDSENPHAGGMIKTVKEFPDEADRAATENEADEEPPTNQLPVFAIVSVFALTAGYFGVRRVWGTSTS